MWIRPIWGVPVGIGISIITAAVSLEMIPERPELTYWNSLYLDYVNFTTHRFSRGADITIDLAGRIKSPWGNNVTADFVFYEFLSNEYKRSFVEFHYKVCDLVKNEKLVGDMLYRAGLKDLTCPYPAGEYAFINMSTVPPNFLSTFPMTKSRLNVEVWLTDRRALIASGHIYLTINRGSKKVLKKNTKRNGAA